MRALVLLGLAASAAAFSAPPLERRVRSGSASPVGSSSAAALRTGSVVMQKEDGVRAGLVTEVPFEVRFSIGNVVSISGGVLLLYCLLSYLLSNGQADLLQTLGFVYAIPALVGGLALKYAELPPVPLTQSGATSQEIVALREAKATKIQKKILSDATRFTYGDVRTHAPALARTPGLSMRRPCGPLPRQAHMEEPLRALKLAPRGMGPPELKALAESTTPSGGYALSMTFYAPNTPYRVWKDRMVRRQDPGTRGWRGEVRHPPSHLSLPTLR
jgi:hypothetical protein